MSDTRAASPTASQGQKARANDAMRTLFLYIYNRLRKRTEIRLELCKTTGHADKVVEIFLGNYGRTSENQSDKRDLAEAIQGIILRYCKSGNLPSYLNPLVQEAFGTAGNNREKDLKTDLSLDSLIAGETVDLENYIGLYEGYRKSTRHARESGPRYIKYMIKIFRLDGDKDNIRFTLCYRSRDYTEQKSKSYSSINGIILKRREKLYFIAAESGRGNLIYIVCFFTASHTRRDWIPGLITTENRDSQIVGARLIMTPTDRDEESILHEIGVHDINGDYPIDANILRQINNKTEDLYVLTWKD